ncbi:small-conductance mechanosensitive channel MscS [Sodalis endosymbiont of Henestaris halophilus]|uniref:small-conductance mechanosensitive channel MscS n=1 Tax=Sodalis endosymbiont of Henestaris halophilus TaxID=1929246 RepID=UPI000BBF60AB|nr:small-conductance mechanosensitive channel MscS [Sodalis endosymbiont of Henestaris halophilus]SNC58630.1 Small-conductance mechanosensitive channel [Sodalis endosymbiont of Henestaris halophilus]
MEDIDVVNQINHASNWLVNNQELLINYAVNIIAVIIILFIGLLVAGVISRTLTRMMKRRHIDATVVNFVSAILRYGIVIFTLIAALNRIGVQTDSVIAVIGAAGLAIGLALQGSLSNFAAGVLLVTFRHFHTGDYVDFAGTSGKVLVVHIFSTTLKTYDGKIVVVPNSKIISGNITNFSQEPNRLIDTIISVSYNADIEVVKKIITDILVADSRVIHDMGLTVRLNAFSPSSMDFIVRAWVPHRDHQNAMFDLLEKTKIALNKHQINIPYPQINVHLYRMSKQ